MIYLALRLRILFLLGVFSFQSGLASSFPSEASQPNYLAIIKANPTWVPKPSLLVGMISQNDMKNFQALLPAFKKSLVSDPYSTQFAESVNSENQLLEEVIFPTVLIQNKQALRLISKSFKDDPFLNKKVFEILAKIYGLLGQTRHIGSLLQVENPSSVLYNIWTHSIVGAIQGGQEKTLRALLNEKQYMENKKSALSAYKIFARHAIATANLSIFQIVLKATGLNKQPPALKELFKEAKAKKALKIVNYLTTNFPNLAGGEQPQANPQRNARSTYENEYDTPPSSYSRYNNYYDDQDYDESPYEDAY